MNLSEQVVSLEIAKKLRELGVKQESLFYHHKQGTLGGQISWVLSKYDEVNIKDDADWLKNKGVAAFTVAELGELLPENSQELEIRQIKLDSGYWLEYWKFNEQIYMVGGEDTEANARANMLIYLLENEIIKP